MKWDPPPRWVKPLPLPILMHAATSIYNDTRPRAHLHCAANMLIVAYFFLMWPGKYCSGTGDSHHPFRLQDIQLYIGGYKINLQSAPPAELMAATYGLVTFTTQKNCVAGETIGHAKSGSPLFCPVRALARCILHLRAHNASLNTPICAKAH